MSCEAGASIIETWNTFTLRWTKESTTRTVKMKHAGPRCKVLACFSVFRNYMNQFGKPLLWFGATRTFSQPHMGWVWELIYRSLLGVYMRMATATVSISPRSTVFFEFATVFFPQFGRNCKIVAVWFGEFAHQCFAKVPLREWRK